MAKLHLLEETPQPGSTEYEAMEAFVRWKF